MACRVLKDKDCVVTSKYGMRKHPTTGVYKLHNGVDVVGEGHSLALITAHTGGVVEYAGYNAAIGYHVNVRLRNGDMMQYNHMTEALRVKTGDTVEQGQVIGTMGSTGYSTGAHLHFGIQVDGEWIDPEPYLYTDYLEEEMTYEQFCEFMTRYEEEKAAKAVSKWAAEAWEKAVADGVFDGTKPQAPLSREQAALVIQRLSGGK